MRKRSVPRYLAIYLGQVVLTVAITTAFGLALRWLDDDLASPAIILPALVLILPPLMTGQSFRNAEASPPGAGEVLVIGVLTAALFLVLVGGLVWSNLTWNPNLTPDMKAEMRAMIDRNGGAVTLGAWAAAVVTVVHLFFFWIVARKAGR